MKIIRYILAAITLLALTTSCQDVVDIDAPPNNVAINVYGRVTDTLGARVRISLTTGYFDEGEIPYINDANVYLYENDIQVGQLSIENDSGMYFLDFNGEVGKTYFIEVVLPNSYEIADTWRSKPEVLSRMFKADSMNIRYLTRLTSPAVFDEGDYALVYFQETPGKGDQYRFRRWLNDSLFTQEFFVWDDEFIDGVRFGDKNPLAPLPGFNIYGPLETGDSVGLEMASISKDYFNYINLLNEQVFQVGSPFDPPPSPIIGNIYNVDDPNEYGFGFFAASALDFSGIKN